MPRHLRRIYNVTLIGQNHPRAFLMETSFLGIGSRALLARVAKNDIRHRTVIRNKSPLLFRPVHNPGKIDERLVPLIVFALPRHRRLDEFEPW